MSIITQKDRTDFLIAALLSMSDEDSRGFRALVAHRPPRYKLLEKRGLIYRTTTCVPERCQYRDSHGPIPGGDCRREGWVLSLRGRLTIELLREGLDFDRAVWLAENEEHDFTETAVVHRRGAQDQSGVIFAVAPSEIVSAWVRKRKKSYYVTQPDAATRAVAGQRARFKLRASAIGDMIANVAAVDFDLTRATYQVRKRERHDA